MERTVKTQRSASKTDEIFDDNEPKVLDNSNQGSSPERYNGRSYSSDSPPPASVNNNNNNTLHRSRSQNKVKLLVRSHAVREETSPPPDPFANESEQVCNGNAVPPAREHHSPQPTQTHSNNPQPQQQPPPQQQTLSKRHKLRREGSSQENWDHPPLSRGNSREQYDGSNQIDLHQFIVETLNRNHKDRMLLLKIESDLISLAKDPKRTVHKFAQMSSYQRMLVHRVAAYFGMDHNVDTTGASVVVNTTKATRIPDMRFRDVVRDDLLLPEEPRRSILKRDSSSFDETGSFKSVDRMLGGDSRRSKSFEEREEEYEKARRRIFNRDHSHGEGDECMDELQWDNDEGLYSQCDNSNIRTPPRLIKVESYESSDTLRANSLRLSVSKSHSFNGYEPPAQTRILTKQDSGSSMSSRISPSSSGYKSRSDATLSATPSPSATPNLHTQLSGQSGGALSPEPETVVWAVTDLASVPPGSMLIHPQTGQPYTNSDGTIYHYDPSNPPRVAVAESQPSPPMPAITQSQKHNMLDSGPVVSPTMSAQSSVHGHEFGKHGNVVSVVENNSYDNGNSGYLTQQALCQGGPHPQAQPHQYSHAQVIQNGDGSAPTHYSTPIVYPMHPAPVPTMSYPIQYDTRVQDNMAANNDLSNYMMGLSIDGSNQPQPRQIMYWPQNHIQSHTSVPVYYNNNHGGVGPTRYPMPQLSSGGCPPSSQAAFVPAPQPPQQHQPAQPTAMVPVTGPPAAHISPEHSGCYSSGYNNGQECVPYPSQAVHMYYTHSYSAGPNGGVSSGGTIGTNGNSYYSSNVSNCSAPILAVQYQQPCPHPASPRTPQGVCSQFAVYNGCYPGHYAQSSSTLPVPPLFRKAMPVGARCVSPMRPPYPISPSTVNERGADDKIPPLPVYGFRVLPGEMRLLGNQGRLPFAISATKGPHPRKHRTKISNQGRPQHSIDVPALNSASKA